jgi:hypothetical protein
LISLAKKFAKKSSLDLSLPNYYLNGRRNKMSSNTTFATRDQANYLLQTAIQGVGSIQERHREDVWLTQPRIPVKDLRLEGMTVRMYEIVRDSEGHILDFVPYQGEISL